jgi:hypothetical protein
LELPDAYTYFIQEVHTQHRVPACFVQLTQDDLGEIVSEAWRGIFTKVWERIVQEEELRKNARKLVCMEGENSIQGLLFLGTGADDRWTLDCLLEAAPQNQYHSPRRAFRGVGKALVARLFAEHTYRGFQTPLLLETSPRALQFYKHIGALTPPHSLKPNRLILPQDVANNLFVQVIDSKRSTI